MYGDKEKTKQNKNKSKTKNRSHQHDPAIANCKEIETNLDRTTELRVKKMKIM